MTFASILSVGGKCHKVLLTVVSGCYQLILLLSVHEYTCLYLYLILLLQSRDTITS